MFALPLHRREFLRQSGAWALAATGLPLASGGLLATPDKQTPETLVKVLYDSLAEKQRKDVCFAWNHLDKNRGLLRTRLENNWKITEPSIKSSFYTSDQQHLIREIFDGMIRHIEYISDADVAYDTACDNQVTYGEGYIRLLTEYCNDETFDQDIKIPSHF